MGRDYYLRDATAFPGDCHGRGAELLVLSGRDEVTAEGKNLQRLYNAITEHRAQLIQQGTAFA